LPSPPPRGKATAGFPSASEGLMSELDKVGPEQKTVYEGFLSITKWSIVLIALVLIGMAIFLV
jgi:hypothetical protein